MCSVVGCHLKAPGKVEFSLLRSVFLEAQVRGRHATGVAYLQSGQVHILKQPGPAEDFPFTPHDWLDEDGSLKLIGHCRYSTSDLTYNQPIGDSSLALVHNGVITQELPEKWSELYGIDCETKNDSELLWHTIKQKKNIYKKWPDSSIACIWLDPNGLRVFRNGLRPLWKVYRGSDFWCVSTRDIALRSNLINSTAKLFKVKNHDTMELQDVE